MSIILELFTWLFLCVGGAEVTRNAYSRWKLDYDIHYEGNGITASILAPFFFVSKTSSAQKFPVVDMRRKQFVVSLIVHSTENRF